MLSINSLLKKLTNYISEQPTWEKSCVFSNKGVFWIVCEGARDPLRFRCYRTALGLQLQYLKRKKQPEF